MTGRLRGTSVLEAVFAVAVASVLAAAASQDAHHRLADLNRLRVAATALTTARNLLEASLGAPCGHPAAIAACPEGLVCTRDSRIFGSPSGNQGEALFRVAVEISERGGEQLSLARFATVVPVPVDCFDQG